MITSTGDRPPVMRRASRAGPPVARYGQCRGRPSRPGGCRNGDQVGEKARLYRAAPVSGAHQLRRVDRRRLVGGEAGQARLLQQFHFQHGGRQAAHVVGRGQVRTAQQRDAGGDGVPDALEMALNRERPRPVRLGRFVSRQNVLPGSGIIVPFAHRVSPFELRR